MTTNKQEEMQHIQNKFLNNKFKILLEGKDYFIAKGKDWWSPHNELIIMILFDDGSEEYNGFSGGSVVSANIRAVQISRGLWKFISAQGDNGRGDIGRVEFNSSIVGKEQKGQDETIKIMKRVSKELVEAVYNKYHLNIRAEQKFYKNWKNPD